MLSLYFLRNTHTRHIYIYIPTAEVGDLDKVKRVVKLLGFVNCVDGFAQQPQVVNGASDFFVEVCQCQSNERVLLV